MHPCQGNFQKNLPLPHGYGIHIPCDIPRDFSNRCTERPDRWRPPPLGQSLKPILDAMRVWGEGYKAGSNPQK